METGARQLLRMSRSELDRLFRAGEATAPAGAVDGTAIVAPGTRLAPALARCLGLAWRGKVFYPDRGELLNRVLPGGRLTGRARFYSDASWLDQRETIVLDYSDSRSGLLRPIRDEIREVAPGLYLGITYWKSRRTIGFALES